MGAVIDIQIRSVGIDLGKTNFHLVALSAAGEVLLRKKFTQKQLITFTANMQTSLMGRRVSFRIALRSKRPGLRTNLSKLCRSSFIH